MALFFACDALAESGTATLVRDLQSPDASRRRLAVQSLEHLGQEAASAVPALAQALSRPENHSLRFEIAQALGETASELALPALRELLNDDEKPVRLRAAVGLKKLQRAEPWPSPAISQALASESRTLKGMAAGALCEIDDEAHGLVESLVTMTRDADWSLRLNAVGALGCIGSEAITAMARVRELASSDPEPLIRKVAAVTAAALDSASSATDDLVAAAQSEEYLVRALAVRALARKPASKPTLSALERALGDGRPEVRIEAARSFGKLGVAASTSIPRLRRAMKDKQPRVRQAAAEALGRITGVPRSERRQRERPGSTTTEHATTTPRSEDSLAKTRSASTEASTSTLTCSITLRDSGIPKGSKCLWEETIRRPSAACAWLKCSEKRSSLGKQSATATPIAWQPVG